MKKIIYFINRPIYTRGEYQLVGELQLKRGLFKELVSPPRLQTNDIPYDSLGLGGSGLGWCRIVRRCRCHGNDV